MLLVIIFKNHFARRNECRRESNFEPCCEKEVPLVLLNPNYSYLIVTHISANTSLAGELEYSLVQIHYWLSQT